MEKGGVKEGFKMQNITTLTYKCRYTLFSTVAPLKCKTGTWFSA